VPADFNRIINTINGVPAEQLSTVEPELGHEACQLLRAVFAEAAAGKAARRESRWGGMLVQAMELLVKDTERTELMLDFSFCSNLTDVSAVGSAVSQLKSLQQLTLNFEQCRVLTDVSAVVSAVSQLKSLQKLTLNFSNCYKLTGMCCLEADLRKALPGAEIEVDTAGTSSCCCRCTIC